MKFSVLMSAWGNWEMAEHATACVRHQSHENWELIVGSDGPAPDVLKDIVSRAAHNRGDRIRLVECERIEGTWGNHVRQILLQHATGDYVCWVNHDNIVFPNYLQRHAENAQSEPGCVSVIPIYLHQKQLYRGVWPVRPIRRSLIDLMNFALPTQLARDVNAFAEHEWRIYAADWHVFGRARQTANVVETTDGVYGIHF